MTHAVQRVAHRGGAALAPENTLAAFQNALPLPIDAIELDVQMTRDGHAIVFHDNTVERLTDGRGNILDLDFVYLRGLNTAAHFRGGWAQAQQIPTLREALDLAKGHVQVYIEIKSSRRGRDYGQYPNIAGAVVSEVRAAEMLDQVLIMSFDWMVLSIVKTLEPTVQTGVLVATDVWNPRADRALERLFEHAAALGCQWINIDSDLFREAMVPAAHTHGFKLGLWTVNSERVMRHYADAGVDSLTSDRPDLFAKL